MLSSSKELKNIPVSISILHEQEYDNLYFIFKALKGKAGGRRAFSERSGDKSDDKSDDSYRTTKTRINSFTLKDQKVS
jgi:hypothetical protein